MQLFQKDNMADKERKYVYLISFIIFCITVSRVLIYFSFLIWKKYTGMEISFWEAISRFDTELYKSIMEIGYDLEPVRGDNHAGANWAFFPLYPLIVKSVHYIFPINYDILGFIINTVLLFFFLIIAAKYILITRNDYTQIIVYIVLMTFGMYSFYLSALYTEMLFLLLIVSFFYCMEKEKYILMGVIGALASATRNTGVMLVFAVAVHYIVRYVEQNEGFSLKIFLKGFFGNYKLILGMSLIPLGLFVYMAYLYLLTGDSMAFVHIQRAWGREISNPVNVLFNSLINVDSFVFYLSLMSVWGYIAFGCRYGTGDGRKR